MTTTADAAAYRQLEATESLQAAAITEALHLEIACDPDSQDSTDWDRLSLLRQRTYRQAGEIAVRYVSREWRDLAARRAAQALVEHLDDIETILSAAAVALGRQLTPAERAEKLDFYARDIVAAYVDTLTGMDPLSMEEQAALMRAREEGQ